MKILYEDEIKNILSDLDPLSLIRDGFIAYSEGKCVVPPVGELSFENPPGDVHIKYGYIEGEDYYVVKIASGFFENIDIGIPNGQGMMLLFKQKTGECEAILLDNAYLTDVRTAVAGVICAKEFSNEVESIGVAGTGLQARMQVLYLKNITPCRQVIVWGRNEDKMKVYKRDMEEEGFNVKYSSDIEFLTNNCNLIITATAGTEPLIDANHIKPGTHITAMGSDTPDKQELTTKLLEKADLLIADSISQCIIRGEISHGIRSKLIQKEDLIELGDILNKKVKGRVDPSQITIADLTGVAVQDIQIAKAVYESYKERTNAV